MDFKDWDDSDWNKANSLNVRHVCKSIGIDFDALKRQYSNFADLKSAVRSKVGQ